MKNDRFWKPVIHQLRHPCPRHPILLTATPQRAAASTVRTLCYLFARVIFNSRHRPPEDWLVHAPSHLLLDLLQLRPHAVGAGFPLDLEFSRTSFAADERVSRPGNFTAGLS